MAQRSGSRVGEASTATGRGHTFARVSREGVGPASSPISIETKGGGRPDAMGVEPLIARAARPAPARFPAKAEPAPVRPGRRGRLRMTVLAFLALGAIALVGVWLAGWFDAPARLAPDLGVRSAGQPPVSDPSGLLPAPSDRPGSTPASPPPENGAVPQAEVGALAREVENLQRVATELERRIGAGRNELAELEGQIAARRAELEAAKATPPGEPPTPAPAAEQPAPPFPFPRPRPDLGP